MDKATQEKARKKKTVTPRMTDEGMELASPTKRFVLQEKKTRK